MEQILRQAVIMLRGMWRHRRLGLAAAWGAGLLGIAVVVAIPDKYEASARLFVNTESILKPLMAGLTVAPDVNQQITLLSRVLMSRPNIEKLVGLTAADAEPLSKEQLDERVDGLIRNLNIRSTGRDQVYTVTLRDRDPESARRVVERFAAMFIESGQGKREDDTGVAKKFIDQQIGAYEKKLEEAENRLKDFKRRYLGMAPGEGKDYFSRMSEASTLLSKAQLELREAEQSRDALRRGLDGLEAQTGAETKADIDTRIEALSRDLDVMLLKYTPAHPDVIGLRRIIQDLEYQRANQSEGKRKDTRSSSLASNQLSVSFAQAEANIASLRARVAEYAARYSQLKQSAMLMPQLEAEFAQLNRDYEVNKKNYESLIARRESISISGEMQSVAGVGDFRLIDPPRVSPRPVWPNRVLLLALALVLSLGAGLAASYAAAMMRPTIYDARALREATHLPILGAVMSTDSPATMRRARAAALRLAGGVAGLLAVYGAGLALMLVLANRSA